MSYPTAIAYPLKITAQKGSVKVNRRSLTMAEHKQVIQACVHNLDYETGRRERLWLSKIHGEWIHKVINAWIQEAQGKLVTYKPDFIKVE